MKRIVSVVLLACLLMMGLVGTASAAPGDDVRVLGECEQYEYEYEKVTVDKTDWLTEDQRERAESAGYVEFDDKKVVTQEYVPGEDAVAEEGHWERDRTWRTSPPEGDGWEVYKTRTVETVPAVADWYVWTPKGSDPPDPEATVPPSEYWNGPKDNAPKGAPHAEQTGVYSTSDEQGNGSWFYLDYTPAEQGEEYKYKRWVVTQEEKPAVPAIEEEFHYEFRFKLVTTDTIWVTADQRERAENGGYEFTENTRIVPIEDCEVTVPEIPEPRVHASVIDYCTPDGDLFLDIALTEGRWVLEVGDAGEEFDVFDTHPDTELRGYTYTYPGPIQGPVDIIISRVVDGEFETLHRSTSVVCKVEVPVTPEEPTATPEEPEVTEEVTEVTTEVIVDNPPVETEVAAVPATTDELPRTGNNTPLFMAIGLALLGAGVYTVNKTRANA